MNVISKEIIMRVADKFIARNRGMIEELDYNRPTTHDHVTHVFRGDLDTIVANRFIEGLRDG